MNQFYVYLYLRTNDRTPYYVGKGQGYRAHSRKGHSVVVPIDARRILVKECASENEAFEMERYLISLYGRRDIGTGILRNMTNGGEGPSGVIVSEQKRTQLRIAQTGKKATMCARRKMSEAQKKMQTKGMLGKIHSINTRQKMSEAQIKRKRSAAELDAFKRNRNRNPLTVEHKEVLSRLKKGKPWSDARRAAQLARAA